MSKQKSDDKRVLEDHRRVGKVLIPPVVHALPNLTEVSYRKVILPETLWIATLIEHFGEADGTRIALQIARSATEFQPASMMGLCSGYAALTRDNINQMKAKLNDLSRISSALSMVAIPYPECPLAALCLPEHIHNHSIENATGAIRQLLLKLLDKTSRPAVMAQAGAVYIGFCTDKIKVIEGLALAQFPEIEKYPDTELSKKVAASVRCALNVLADGQAPWPKCFWNRGKMLAPCTFEETHDS